MMPRFPYLLAVTFIITMAVAWPVQANISVEIDDSTRSPTTSHSENGSDKESVIIEVEGDPNEHRKYMELYHPFIDVIATYDLLFNGLALQGKPDKLAKISSLEFIRAIHPIQTYDALSTRSIDREFENIEQANTVIPSDVNRTPYTGKGIKVAVIDTGIDYQHPDLMGNYKGGYDLVDLDDDPMETVESEGIPTLHGSHVAGIIAANGNLKGVAPEADIYAYRALGPGGQGTSVQVIAAMEQAARDDVDIMNLSLGNSINGPDYPTSVAVNRATEMGIAVVIANGNSGPDTWTVGSPATATKAISVGAASSPEKIPYLYEATSDRSIPLMMMIGSEPWNVDRGNGIANMDKNPKEVQGKIAISERSDVTFYDKAKMAEENGAIALLIYNNEEGMFQGAIANNEDPVSIPVASLSMKDGKWLETQIDQSSPHLETKYHETPHTIAPFSSRGPVTVNWEVKPDVLAPGTNILSTVPGGYQKLQGTSMAAPHVAGAIALMKEAKPKWTNEQIVGALKTTALKMEDEDGEWLEPIVQGAGHIEVNKAINTDTIIYNPILSFGLMDGQHDEKEVNVTIENISDQTQQFYFDIPKKKSGTHYMKWNLPQSFSLKPKSKKTISIGLNTNPSLIEEGLHQGWLALRNKEETFHLPYLFVNQTADYPRTMGFGFSLKAFTKDTYAYQLYVTEEAKKVDVHLYEPDSLMYKHKLLELTEPKVGLNEGEMNQSALPAPGVYKAVITIELENGEYKSEETELVIMPN